MIPAISVARLTVLDWVARSGSWVGLRISTTAKSKFRIETRAGVLIVLAQSRLVKRLNHFHKVAQHLAKHTGGAQVTPAAWMR